MNPKINALRIALRALDASGPHIDRRGKAFQAVSDAAQDAGFDRYRCLEDWARYTVAVAECTEEPPEPEQERLFA